MSKEKEFDLEVKPNIIAKASPDFEDVQFKATAGETQKDIIERYTIGELKEKCDEEDDKEKE